MRDSQLLISIYKKYLIITSDLVEVLEKHYEKLDTDCEPTKIKRKEFVKHAHNIIQRFHDDLHILFRLSYELKDLEKEN